MSKTSSPYIYYMEPFKYSVWLLTRVIKHFKKYGLRDGEDCNRTWYVIKCFLCLIIGFIYPINSPGFMHCDYVVLFRGEKTPHPAMPDVPHWEELIVGRTVFRNWYAYLHWEIFEYNYIDRERIE